MKKQIPVHLTNVEQTILNALKLHQGKIVDRETLNAICEIEGNSNAIDVHVKNLRRKMIDIEIETVRGAGYRLK